MKTKKGISLIILVITIIVALILITVVITSLSLNRADLQAKKLEFQQNYKVLNNELYSYISDIKLSDATSSVNINASGDKLSEIMPSIKKMGFEDIIIICDGQLVFKENSNMSDNEKEWAKEIAPIVSSCSELNAGTDYIGMSLSKDGGVINIPVGSDTATISTQVLLENTESALILEYAFSNTNYQTPSEFTKVNSSLTVSQQKTGGTYYLWIKVYNVEGEYLGKYVSKPFTLRYTITYNMNGGVDGPETQYKNNLSALALSIEKPTKEGYTFAGWSVGNTSTVSYLPGQAYSTDKSVCLYAVWKDENTSMLIVKEDTGKETILYGKTGESIKVDTVPKKEGYEFVGWSFNGSGTFNSSSNTYVFGDGIGTLTARWQEAVALVVEDDAYFSKLDTAIFSCGTETQKEVKLIKDITLTVTSTIPTAYNVKLNLNEKTITATQSGSLITNNGTLQIYNGTVNSNSSLINNNGKLIIDSGTYTCASAHAIVNNTGSIDINGGTIISKIANAIYQGENSNITTINVEGALLQSEAEQTVIGINGNVTFNLNGGTIKNTSSGSAFFSTASCNININDGAINATEGFILYAPTNLTINGGRIITLDYSVILNDNNASFILNDGYVANSNNPTVYVEKGNVKVNNGTLYSVNDRAIYNNYGNITLLGGSIISDSSTLSAIHNGLNGVLSLGENDLSVSITIPKITGNHSGISGYMNFYDGIIVANEAIVANVLDMPNEYTVLTLVSNSKQVAYLVESKTAYLYLNSTTGGTVTGEGNKVANSNVTVIATPLDDYEFIGWYDDQDNLVSDSKNYTFVMPDSALTLTAKFQNKNVYFYDIGGPGFTYDQNNFYCTGGTFYFKFKDSNKYTINLVVNTGTSIRVKNENETEFTTVYSGTSNTSYTVQAPCEVSLSSALFTVNFTLENGTLANIVDDRPIYNVNLYSPNENTLYASYSAKKFDNLNDYITTPTRNGFKFVGWSRNADSNIGLQSHYITSDVDLYAIWQILPLYLEPNIPNANITNGDTYNGTNGSSTYVRLLAPNKTYSISATMQDYTSLIANINLYSLTGWLNDSKTSTLHSGDKTVSNYVIDYPQDNYLGFLNNVKDLQFTVDGYDVPLKHIIDGFDKDGLVYLMDGRYNSAGVTYSTEKDRVVNLVDTSYTSYATNNLTRGYNYFSFNGTDSVIELGELAHDTYKDAFTLETVFRGTQSQYNVSTSQEEDILSNLDYGGMAIYISSDGRIKGVAHLEGGYKRVVYDTIYDKSICKASLTYNGSLLCLYINGELVDSLSLSGEVGAPVSNELIVLGTNPKGGESTNTYFKGEIYSAAVYNRALSAIEIKNNYLISKIHIPGLK